MNQTNTIFTPQIYELFKYKTNKLTFLTLFLK